MTNIRRMVSGALLVCASAPLVVGCSGGHSSETTGPSVRLRNFAIDAPATLRAGTIDVRVIGVGPTMHEFNIARTSLSHDDLPTTSDDTVDDQQDTPTFHHVAEKEGLDIGATATMRVTLEPGHYVLYCNMEGHYMAGMSADLTVTS